jgi:hypothetical protein
MLSKDEIAFYHTNGYLAVEDVLASEEVVELQNTGRSGSCPSDA